MTEQIPCPFPTALDIRADFALAKVYRRFGLGEHHRMIGEALTAAQYHAFEAHCENLHTPVCPTLFADEPELVEAWATGKADSAEYHADMAEIDCIQREEENAERWEAEYRADRLAHLQQQPFPTGAELLAALQAGEPAKLDQNTLRFIESDGIWVTNAYGLDSLLLEPTVEACQSFVDAVRAGGEFGLSPD